MTDSNVLQADLREDVGKGASRRLRRQGKIPAVIYGGKTATAMLSLEHDPIMHAAASESFYSSILKLKVPDGRVQAVVVRDVHRHPFKAQIMHLDFMRVSTSEVFRMSLPIHFIDEDESEAGKTSGVVIQHLVTDIEVEALPQNLPEFLAVDMSGLELGDVIMLSDIVLPDGVVIPSLLGDADGDNMIANTAHIKESQGSGVYDDVDDDDDLDADADADLDADGTEDGAEVSEPDETS
jgi:large subunit ribosomal protein L25